MTDTIFLDGPIGKIEVFVDYPEGTAKGFAVVCHPHPLQGLSLIHIDAADDAGQV